MSALPVPPVPERQAKLLANALRGIADALELLDRHQQQAERAVEDDELVDPQTAAKLLNVSASFVWRALREHTLRGVKLGPKLWRVRRSEIEAFKRRRETR